MDPLPADPLGVHIDATGIHFGLLLPGVSPASGTSFALAPTSLAPWGDAWTTTLPLTDSLFLRPGQYVYRYKVTRTLADGWLLSRDFLSDPFAREFGVGKLSAFTLGYVPHVWSAAEAGWRTPAKADLVL